MLMQIFVYWVKEALVKQLSSKNLLNDWAITQRRETISTIKPSISLFRIVLYQDMNSRELVQQRRMLENGDTIWEDSQVTFNFRPYPTKITKMFSL
jgi:hypothetical protein